MIASGTGPKMTARIKSFFAAIDRFTLMLIGTVILASLLPAGQGAAKVVSGAASISVVVLFFLHGAKLPREAVISGLTHWRLHLFVLATTFVLFPLMGLALGPVAGAVGMSANLYTGFLFLCCLPSTVQSSIALTSIARGNVPAAICSASASNLLGIALTPLLAGVILGTSGGFSLGALGSLLGQLLLPFVAGQIMRRWISGWMARHKQLVGIVDRGSILLMVYSAFSHAVRDGIWHRTSLFDIIVIMVLSLVILAIALSLTYFGGGRLGFNRPDRITMMFCGSKKSLVSGVPIANVLFAPAVAGVVVLPIMIFHQLQLLVCAELARRFAASAPAEEEQQLPPAPAARAVAGA